MARRVEPPAVEFRCETCGQTPPADIARSTENWTVYPTTCPADGGRVKPVIGGAR